MSERVDPVDPANLRGLAVVPHQRCAVEWQGMTSSLLEISG